MMKISFKILFGSIIALLLTVGCSQLYDKNESICTKEQPVTIIATIDDARTRTNVMTRANGNVTPGSGNDTWKPEEVTPEDYERTIAHIFLFAYKAGSDTPEKVILYYANGKQPNGILSSIEQREFQNAGATTGADISMNLELYPGLYNFVLIVNSTAALEAAKTGIPDPASLKEDNIVLTSDDLNGADRKYLPMVGQSQLRVPNYTSGSESDRVKINPAIDLERVHARVEFILTTENDAGEYLSPILPLSKVTGLTLENEQKKYTVMPSIKDYTVTATGPTAPGKPIRAAALTTETPMTGRQSFHQSANTGANGMIDKFKGRLLTDSTNPTVKKYIYVAPSTLATSQDKCLTLVFKVRFINDREDTVYKIPLTNVGKNLTGNQEFVTRRNTIYRLNAKLEGRKLSIWDYIVINWYNQDVDIPW